MVWDIIQNPLQEYKELLISILPRVSEFEEALADVLNSEFYLHLGYLKKSIKN